MNTPVRHSLILLLLAVVFSVTACQTVKGAGKDIEQAGEAIQDEAEKND